MQYFVSCIRRAWRGLGKSRPREKHLHVLHVPLSVVFLRVGGEVGGGRCLFRFR